MASLVPRPNIQANFLTFFDGQARMNRLAVAFPVRIEVHPEHHAALPRLERDTLRGILAFENLTPSAVMRHVQPGEVRSSPDTIRMEIHHERTHPARALRRRCPAVVQRVITRNIIPLGPQALDERVPWPTLERQSAGFDTLHGVVSVDDSLFRFANRVVGDFFAAVEDG